MPKIQPYTQKYGTPTAVRATGEEFGAATGRALQQAGQFGMGVAAQMQENKTNEDKRKVKNVYLKAQKQMLLERDANRSNVKYWDNYPTWAEDNFHQMFDKALDEAGLELNDASRTYSDDLLQEGMFSVFKNESVYATAQKINIRVKTHVENGEIMANSIALDPSLFDEYWKGIDSDIDLQGIPADKRSILVADREELLLNSRNNAFLTKAESADDVLDVLDTFKKDDLNKKLSPQQYQAFINRADTYEKSYRNREKAALIASVGDELVKLNTGEFERTITDEQIINAYGDDTDAALRKIRQLEIAEEDGQLLQTFGKMSLVEKQSELKKQIADILTGDYSAQEAQQSQKLVNLNIKLEDQLHTDPVKYVHSYSEPVNEAYEHYSVLGSTEGASPDDIADAYQSYLALSMTTQSSFFGAKDGVIHDNVRLLSKDEITYYENKFRSVVTGAGDTSAELNNLQNKAGVYWKDVYAELATNLPDEIYTASDMSHNPQAAAKLIALSGTNVNDLISESTMRSSIRISIEDATQDVRKVHFRADDGAQLYIKKVNSAMKLAGAYMGEGMSEQDAVNVAVRNVTGGYVYGDSFAIPSDNQDVKSLIHKSDRFISDFYKKTEDGGFAVLDGISIDAPDDFKEKHPDVVRKAVADRGYLVNNPKDPNSLLLKYTVDVTTGHQTFVRSNGKNLVISYDDILNIVTPVPSVGTEKKRDVVADPTPVSSAGTKKVREITIDTTPVPSVGTKKKRKRGGS